MTKNNLSFFTATVALAGFLFGFDTVVISGANLPIKELWHTTPLFHGTFIMSMALWGTVLGAILGSFPTNLWGRKKTLLMIGILFGLSALVLPLPLVPTCSHFSGLSVVSGSGYPVLQHLLTCQRFRRQINGASWWPGISS